MRKHLSIFMLILRSSIYKLLVIMLGMAVVEAAILAIMPEAKTQTLNELIDSSQIYYAYLVAAAITVALMLSVCSFGSSKPRYTLARLSVSEKCVMYWHWLAAFLVFILLWLWQIMLLQAFALWHSAVAEPGYISSQSIYLANFRSQFIHSLLPLEDTSRFIRNVVMALCMGGICATGAHNVRRGKKPMAPIVLIAVFGGTYRAEHFEISYDGFMMVAFAIVLIVSLASVYTGDAEVDYEEASLEN